ncbi:signal peptidase I [Pseudodesulfovibrio sp. JC047]|uniref:signal peptidase I n=1 Tax=Pseudodesulfovibrio sp. JC047 TaxID=2683199 RepID=UPI0013D2ED7E|nr:signal peptidase I [Pseudodesulfovibrio sp. JC047]NDV19520.1 signal peptidase I [Pseudodesulfovibrio sp. JC047]
MTDTNILQSVSDFKPRRPWLAGLSSFIVTGLGQVYNGQWKKGIGFLLAELVFSLGMMWFMADFVSMLLCLAIVLGYKFFVAGEAYVSAQSMQEYTPGKGNRWWVYGLFMVVNIVLGILLQLCLSQPYKTYTAASGSMIPALYEGDYFMAENLEEGDALRRGDVVIFSYPKDENITFIKRVIGLPGETLDIRRQQVFIDGQRLEESYARHTKDSRLPQRDVLQPVTLGADEYFVMGDNREESYDSRWWGAVKRDKILARARYVYLPSDKAPESWIDRLGLDVR